MRVNHVEDHVTTATIGGMETTDFGVESNAEFMHMLSATLYTDQKLAVVREVLCNAWDAHIEADCTDKPIEITIDGANFIVRDYGNGIPHDLIKPIYGVYGASTKKNDGRATGGFGLGCKSPFAYTDSFEVTSWNQGTKTVYNMARSTLGTDTKPGITPLLQMSSEETGLQVSLEILNATDRMRFIKLVKRIVLTGGINATLNGDKLETLPFDTMEHGFMVVASENMNLIWETPAADRVFVRYGNVIYPIPKEDSIACELGDVNHHLKNLSSDSNRYWRGDDGARNRALILQAPPHSITVAPSREALSMQKHTVTTLKQLLKNYLEVSESEMAPFVKSYIDDTRNQIVESKDIHELLSHHVRDSASNLAKHREINYELLAVTEGKGLSILKMEKGFPSGATFRKNELIKRVRAGISHGLLNTQMALDFIEEIKKTTERHYSGKSTRWIYKHLIKPAVRLLNEAGVPDDRLHMFDLEAYAGSSRWNKGPTPYPGNLRPWTKVRTARGDMLGSFFGKQLVVTHDIHEIQRDMSTANLQGWTGRSLVLRMPYDGKEGGDQPVENIVKLFSEAGWNVFNITTTQRKVKQEEAAERARKLAIRREKAKANSTTVVAKPRNAFVPLSMCLLSTGRANFSMMTKCPVDKMITNPRAVVKVSLAAGKSKDSFEVFDSIDVRWIAECLGDQIAIVNTQASYNKLIKSGCKTVSELLVEAIKEWRTQPEVIEEATYSADCLLETLGSESRFTGEDLTILRIAIKVPELGFDCAVEDKRTDKQKIIGTLVKILIEGRRRYSCVMYSFPRKKDILPEGARLSSKFGKAVAAVYGNRVHTRMLDGKTIEDELVKASSTNRAKIVQLLKLALNLK